MTVYTHNPKLSTSHSALLNSIPVVATVQSNKYLNLKTSDARIKPEEDLRNPDFKADRQNFGEIIFEENEMNGSLNYTEKIRWQKMPDGLRFLR